MAKRPVKSGEVADRIAADLATYEPGQWLPTWSEMATTYEVSRTTIQSARAILVERGLIEVVKNQGARMPLKPIYRSESEHANLINGERGFRAAMRAQGHEPWDELLGVDSVEASTEVAGQLGVPVGTTVLRRSRAHGIVDDGDQSAVMLSWTWVAPFVEAQLPILSERDTGPGGMSSRFQEDLGLRLHWEVAAAARLATEAEAKGLALEAGAPVLVAWRRCFDQDHRILEVTLRVIDSRNYLMVFAFGE